MLRIDNIKIFTDLDKDELIAHILKKYKIPKEELLSFQIVKKSIDARDKKNVHYNYSVNISLTDESLYPKFKTVFEPQDQPVIRKRNSEYNPIIVGSGPAGLFCALTLVQNGIKPIIIEQGKQVEERQKEVEKFRKTGKLNTQSNVQFGEGGAGTFSDGKLTSRSK